MTPRRMVKESKIIIIFSFAEEVDPSYNITLPSKKRKIEDFENLPETCTLLRTKKGGRVYVVGTAHFSHESQVRLQP